MNSVVCGFRWFSMFLVGLVVVVLLGLVVVSCFVFFSPAEQSTTGSPYWDDGFRDRVVLAHLISLSNHFCDTFGISVVSQWISLCLFSPEVFVVSQKWTPFPTALVLCDSVVCPLVVLRCF